MHYQGFENGCLQNKLSGYRLQVRTLELPYSKCLRTAGG